VFCDGLQQKVASWFSLVFIAQALANMKNMENDLKQIIMALTYVFALPLLLIILYD
jgi:hypothetical protein